MSEMIDKKLTWTPQVSMDGTQWLIMFGIALTGLFLIINITDLIQSYQTSTPETDKKKNKRIGVGVVAGLLFLVGAGYYGYNVYNGNLTNKGQLLSFSAMSMGLLSAIYLIVGIWQDLGGVLNTGVSVIMFGIVTYLGWQYSPGKPLTEILEICREVKAKVV